MWAFILVACIMYPYSLSDAQLVQCLHHKCQDPRAGKRNHDSDMFRPVACEPRNDGRDVAPLGTIRVSPVNATCRSPEVQFCSLKNRFSCMTCDAEREDMSHEPSHMIDGIKWTWWQSVPWPGPRNEPLSVNITLTLPKVFLLTDDIKIDFFDGRPQVTLVEKSADYGKTWTAMEYFADDCQRRFGMPKTPINKVFTTVKEALSPFCSEDYSSNFRWDMSGVLPVAVVRRLNALTSIGMRKKDVCTDLWNDTNGLKSFLEITNLRIRLLSPAIINTSSSSVSEDLLAAQYIRRSEHYGLRKIEISARCQCNGHASSCKYGKKTAKCKCEHNTFGSECQKCQPLFWIEKWKPGIYSANRVLGDANPCLSYYSKWYRDKVLREGRHYPNDRIPSTTYPEPCRCNRHSDRCEAIPGFGIACVDCRHNTEGQNCHSCRQTYYKDPALRLDSPKVCKACNCSRFGSYSRWCGANGQCHCKVGFRGKMCDQCVEGLYMVENICYPLERECLETFVERCREFPFKETMCSVTATQWCICSKYKRGNCSFMDTNVQGTSKRIKDGVDPPDGGTNIISPYKLCPFCPLILLYIFLSVH